MSAAMYQTTSSQEQAKDLKERNSERRAICFSVGVRKRWKIKLQSIEFTLILTAALLSVVCPMYLTL